MDDIYHLLATLLLDVEKQLRDMSRWSETRPSKAAMASEQPFAVDTMSFDQWLQFIFLPQMYRLIERGDKLPMSCRIAPMAEEFFSQSDPAVRQLIASLEQIDQLITEHVG